jgi:hypothetical protein
MIVEEFVKERRRLPASTGVATWCDTRGCASEIPTSTTAPINVGYELTILPKTVQNNFYRDAHLYAIWYEAGRTQEVEDPWFYGYSTTPRWMKLTQSRTSMRSLPAGIALTAPAAPEANQALQLVVAPSSVVPFDDGHLLLVPQVDRDGELIDSVDVCSWVLASSVT